MAIVLLAGGALACFVGHRVFRIVLAVFGFVAGALLAATMSGQGADEATLLAAMGIGGVIGAAVFVLAHYVGVAIVGAALGVLLLHTAWTPVTGEPPVWLVVALAAVGALGALVLQRYVIITGTAFGGAWTLLAGALILMGEASVANAATPVSTWIAYPLDPAPGRTWLIPAWLVLGGIGMAVQLMFAPRRGR